MGISAPYGDIVCYNEVAKYRKMSEGLTDKIKGKAECVLDGSFSKSVFVLNFKEN